MKATQSVLAAEDAAMVRARYQDRIARLGLVPESQRTGGAAKQRRRHATHLKAVLPSTRSVLEVGCGLGEFLRYLRDDGGSRVYTGYDIVPEYVTWCENAFPAGTFRVRNIFEDGIEGEFDTVVMCQVLNNRFTLSDNFAVMQSAIEMAYAQARVSVSIDMMSCYVDYEEDYLFYYSPADVLAFAKTLCPYVALRHDYLPFEFCVQLFREPPPPKSL